MEWQPEATGESVDELAVFQALGAPEIVIQMAYHQVAETDHWQQFVTANGQTTTYDPGTLAVAQAESARPWSDKALDVAKKAMRPDDDTPSGFRLNLEALHQAPGTKAPM